MRILHLSDVHCDAGALRTVISAEPFDLLVITGDFGCLEVLEHLEGMADRAVAVTGNMDDVSIRRRLLSMGLLVDGRVREVRGLRVGGVGGIDPKADIVSLRSDLKGSGSLDVLVTHHPPKGVLDRTFMGLRIGLQAIGELARSLRPRLHLFGHVHESPGQQVYDGIVAVNPGPAYEGRYAVIEMDDKGVRVELRRADAL